MSSVRSYEPNTTSNYLTTVDRIGIRSLTLSRATVGSFCGLSSHSYILYRSWGVQFETAISFPVHACLQPGVNSIVDLTDLPPYF